jgi:putative nucleotidyltransferase with HDIG domain
MVMYAAAYIAGLVLEVAPAGLAYYLLGGRFLIDGGTDLAVLPHFVFPFLGLVATSTAVHVGQYALLASSVDPIPGTRGISGFLLRARLVLVETAMPIGRGQLFLSVVALLVAYLYWQIGVLGFVLAITPVLALRDFFSQWVEEKTAYLNTITTLATYMQHYHPYTRGHLKRVADMSERLARELRLPVESIRHMNAAAFLHDIGKIGVSEEILDKPAQLTDDEWAKIKEHPVKGAEIISHLEFLEGIVDWIKYHHKWHNGAGYPATNGDGSEIPIEAAIIATADAFDAMTDDRELTIEWKCDCCGFHPDDGDRPVECPQCGAEKRRRYREPRNQDDAIDELRRGAGTQFHPRVVKAFLSMVERDGIRLNA